MRINETITATLEAVSHFGTKLESHLQSLTVDTRTTILLAVQELLVNIVRHAYNGQDGLIHFDMFMSASEISITVVDGALNALDLNEPIAELDPLDLPESGMGLFIIYQSFDTIEYAHLQPGNRWHLVKRLGD